MIDMTEFTRAVKRVAVQAVKETVPANAVFGTVVSTEPLQIDDRIRKTNLWGTIGITIKFWKKYSYYDQRGKPVSYTHD